MGPEESAATSPLCISAGACRSGSQIKFGMTAPGLAGGLGCMREFCRSLLVLSLRVISD